MTTNFETVDKEIVPTLKFPNTDVLNNLDAIHQRKTDLDRAQALGNIDRSKIKFFFEDNQSKKVVETTVWAVTDSSVVLKKGAGIPINRIFRSI